MAQCTISIFVLFLHREATVVEVAEKYKLRHSFPTSVSDCPVESF